ncbi:MAG TPA: LPP20 family lipoprotein [Gallionella sp.]|nr:LPP20 family lipoprotein [Gallionella sp.]
MRKVLVGAMLAVGLTSSPPVRAGIWSSCDAGSTEPKPDWVSMLDYSLPGFYVGVGSADKGGKSKEEQIKAAENDAKSRLVQSIEVTIKAENVQSTSVSNQGVHKDALSKVSVSAEEVLRDLQIKGRWVDPATCTHYALMVISNKSVAQAKHEKIMKSRLAIFKAQLAEGLDRDKNRDIKARRKYLEDAQALLADTDFSLLPEELGKEVYAKRLSDALASLNKDASQVKGRVALFAINQDGSLRADVIGKMLDQLRSGDNTADRLMADCNTVEDCISRAKERGFTMLALLKASSQVVTSQMGSLKGTLSVSRTVYDIESHKVLKGPDTASAQVIGWSNEELDWVAAAEKAMQGLK